MKKQGQVWVRITDFPDYAISGDGRVMRLTDGAGLSHHGKAGRILTHCYNSQGYASVTLRRDKKPRTAKIHRLVAEHFIPNPEAKPVINHLNGNKAESGVSNIEWATRSENGLHAFATGLNTPQRGENGGNARLRKPQVDAIRQRRETGGASYKQIAKEFRISPSQVARIYRREQWT